jgi:protein-tyrosine kinase
MDGFRKPGDERVSVIENALEKLRRRSAPERGAGSGTPLQQPREVVRPHATVSVATRPSAAVESPNKRITVDLNSLRTAGYLPSDEQRRRVADEYRRIKRPLIEKAFARHAASDMRLILVSSALPGDGKTFTTINLALSMARERDLSVLLVDADVPKAHVSHVFGLGRDRGLMDALLDDSLDVESLVVRTDIQGLQLLPAGKSVENATELLASARMAQIAERIGAQSGPRRIVLIDSSPILASSEADALLRISGQIVMVVRASATPRQAVLEALAHVDENKLQGLILNQVHQTRGDGYYYYYGHSSQSSSGNGTPGAE